MKALIVSFKRGRHLIHPRQAIIKVSGIEDKRKAGALVGKKIVFKTKSGRLMTGVITKAHGGNGLVRARFDKGLPGQAIGQEVTLK
ncbi:MAG: 50S ribosomal protein L35ae [Candidatus Nanoarchaeia archaeon]|jgi:large subunit ribosomal protein L35Ae